MKYLHILSVLVIGYIFLFIMAKLLGKTQITQITPFDFISAIVLGELVGNALYDQETGILEIFFAVTVWGTLIYATETLTQKFKRARKLLEGEPSIVIKKGKIIFEELKKNHLDLNQLQHLLRSKDVFSIRECEYAILETDGTVSAFKKPLYATPTIQDLNLPIYNAELPVTLILDGEVVWDNLKSINWDETILKNEIKKYGASGVKDVLYAEWKKGEALHVQTY
ncbi:DUF421 domain-containing protein [Cytobacillus firmus]|uniref:DUF421 domain-containing protein n=1 Tax=Cytobacillus firmus TaxID=1399 RepID=UPI001580794B|nr:DUF421 domain-containing protein [Cytobacillus firmus]MBG9549603.1 membrane protein [Cytobacillus firmus]MBG9605073.1 membrane protein [Cytobacillus firmus]MBG9655362.1 membrane protein [Cytobacillus firmus]MDD9313153.1 DUF421 domain-containing protein [Cytobacillus firmus]MED1908108.1 DUF421 domain-containing protein [Cytobacillus firmus]